jgi:hypothetical protein
MNVKLSSSWLSASKAGSKFVVALTVATPKPVVMTSEVGVAGSLGVHPFRPKSSKRLNARFLCDYVDGSLPLA